MIDCRTDKRLFISASAWSLLCDGGGPTPTPRDSVGGSAAAQAPSLPGRVGRAVSTRAEIVLYYVYKKTRIVWGIGMRRLHQSIIQKRIVWGIDMRRLHQSIIQGSGSCDQHKRKPIRQ